MRGRRRLLLAAADWWLDADDDDDERYAFECVQLRLGSALVHASSLRFLRRSRADRMSRNF